MLFTYCIFEFRTNRRKDVKIDSQQLLCTQTITCHNFQKITPFAVEQSVVLAVASLKKQESMRSLSCSKPFYNTICVNNFSSITQMTCNCLSCTCILNRSFKFISPFIYGSHCIEHTQWNFTSTQNHFKFMFDFKNVQNSLLVWLSYLFRPWSGVGKNSSTGTSFKKISV